MTRTILAILLLCFAVAPVVADGPLFSIWHIDGHGYSWQQAQIDTGLPIEPSVRMVHSAERNLPGHLTALNANAPILATFNGKSIVLRMNNICPELDRTIPRISPLTEETWRQSHMCIVRLADGTLDDVPNVCPFAGTAAWTEVGRLWATSIWMKRLQEIIPNPSGIILRENNEGGRLTLSHLYQSDRPRVRSGSGSLVFASGSDNPSLFLTATGEPLTADWVLVGGGTSKWYMYRWKPDEMLDSIDLRAKEWVAPRRGTLPSDSLPDWTALENAQYAALYAAFDANSAAGWQGKLRTCGYGDWSENRQNDAASPAMYLGFYRDKDLTKPGAYSVNRWDAGEELENETGNPDAWREYSISVGNPANTVYAGYQMGRHAVVDPESFAGLMSHVAWRMQSPGREVRLVYWDNYNCKPSHLIFATGTNKTTLSQGHVDALTAIGRQDMLSLTIEDYELAVMRSLARVHDNPVIERYWREGTTVLLTSPLNTATATKVYATETSIPGERATLLCVYTPCDLAGEIQVGGWTVQAKRFAYYLTGSVQEIE